MVSNPQAGALVEDTVLEVIQQGQLTQWQEQLIFGKSIRYFDHFALVSDSDYKAIGMSPEDIKKLRNTMVHVARAHLNSNNKSQMVYVANTGAASSSSASSNVSFIKEEQIKLMQKLGDGNFAVVKRGIWCREDGRKIDVAVKILKNIGPLVMEELKIEADHLSKLKHPNLIQMFGVVMQPPMMVFELCEGGSLLDRLRDDKRPMSLLTTLLDYCMQIVKAMSYLEKAHCVHRDLATRNILLSKDERTAKICDLGLMRSLKENEEMYIMGPQKKVPFSWCPPEALKHRKFSHASDVWAFGVTVWEIFSLGEEPWIGCRAIDVLKRLDAGERLEKPRYCTDQIYNIISDCWKISPDNRPKFSQLKGFLQEYQFNQAEVRESQAHTDEKLGMTIGDRIILVTDKESTLYGQNARTTRFGSFPRSAVFIQGKTGIKPAIPPAPIASISTAVKPPPAIMVDNGNSKISRPIKGSFIHTGHADGRGGNSWGQAGVIDDIYLKNAVMGAPLEGGIPLVVPSILGDAPKAVTPTRVAPLPPSSSSSGKPPNLNIRTNMDPLKPDWGDFDAAQMPSFSPSKIDLPPLPAALANLGLGPMNIQNVYNPQKDTPSIQPTVMESKPVIPTHHRSASNQPGITHHQSSSSSSFFQQQHHSHNVIFPTATNAGTLPIHQPKPNLPLISSQTTASQMKPSTQSSSQPTRPPLPNTYGSPNAQRSPVVTQANPRLSADQKKDIPIIRPLDYKTPLNNGATRSTFTSTTTQNQPKNLSSAVIDRNRNLINELNVKIQPTTGGPSFRNVHANPPNISSAPQLTSSASDPFVVSPYIQGVMDSKRYNEILEKTPVRPQPQLQIQPTTQITRPHTAIGQATCLVPTPAASQNPPLSSKTPTKSNARPSVPVPPPSTIIQTKPLTVVIPEKREERPHSSSVGTSSTNQIRSREQPIGATPAGTLPRDTDRQSRIEAEIDSILPKPSKLFYGKDQPDEVTMRPSTSVAQPRPHSVTGVPFPNVRPSTSIPTPVKPLDPPLSMSNVLQPIRLHTPAPPPQPAFPKERNIDVASIMNAYQHGPMFMNPLNPPPDYNPSQVPLFALGGQRAAPLPITNYYPTATNGTTEARASFNIGDDIDIVAALDPLAIRADDSLDRQALNDRASAMEILYREAEFVDPSRCDEMVKLCKGDIEAALKELKMEYLVDMNLAINKGLAYNALESNQWDLNKAANSLFT